MKKKIFYTDNHWTGLIARVILGLLMLPHGLQKTFGLFGGYGYNGTMGWLTQTMHIPSLIAFLVIVAEFVGAVSLIAGFATRFWSFVMIPLMLGAVLMVHMPHGLFMNWSGTAGGEGYEYHIAIIALAVISLVNGAGKFSIDRQIAAIIH